MEYKVEIISADSLSPRALEETLRMAYGHRIIDVDAVIAMYQNGANGLGWAATIKDTIVGVSLGIVIPTSKVEGLFGESVSSVLANKTITSELVGVPLLTGVLASCRNLKIGKHLMKQTCDSIKSRLKDKETTANMLTVVPCPPVDAPIFAKENYKAIKSIMSNLGFKRAKTLPDFWTEGNETSYYCQFCDTTPCRCAGSVYVYQGVQNGV